MANPTGINQYSKGAGKTAKKQLSAKRAARFARDIRETARRIDSAQAAHAKRTGFSIPRQAAARSLHK